VGIIVLAPLLLSVGIVIKLTSPGPVFYRGVRTGLYGKPFRLMKFRTIVQDAEVQGGPSTGLDDARVTSVGRVLRRLKFDELPNLFNVVIGEMSLVGPRPEVPQYTALYTGDEKLILTVRPGITDLSSLHFIDLQSHIGAVDVDANFERLVLPEKNRLRVEYVMNWSLLGDIKILARTIARIFLSGQKSSGIH